MAPTLPTKIVTVDEYGCDFDKSLCGMTQDTEDNLDWIRTHLPTPSSDTGPRADHTSGKGEFLTARLN